ncbi:MAG: flagellar motor stator protein MotA [Gammaproteobacteria bacterium]|nr:flagellar motor stator protein MotA [Gammaproteobacteria bacterium]
MFVIIGLVVLFGCVFGFYVNHGGSMAPIMEAAPTELGIIFGAGIGAMVIGNSLDVLKAVGAGVGKTLSGSAYHKQEFQDTITLIVKLFKLFKAEGAVALEPHIENPEASAVFGEYPKLLKDHALIEMICDTIRLLVTSNQPPSPDAVEDTLNVAIKTHHHAALKPAEALTSLEGALPALGIVACVLGVVKTMAAIDQPPSVLGALIGSALVGTFLGVFLAYGIVGPLAGRLKQIVDEEGQIYVVAKWTLIGHLKGYPVPLIIESARAAIDHHSRPTFAEVFDGLRGK